MQKNNQDISNQAPADKESCCSQSSCCAPKKPVVYTQAKVGRNELCPCDSGRKFKKCCG